MIYFVLAALGMIAAIFIWAPWSRAKYFDDQISAEYKEWEGAEGYHGYALYIRFKTPGRYEVTATYSDEGEEFKITKKYTIEQKRFADGVEEVVENIDIQKGPTFVTVSIRKWNTEPETHKLRMG